MVAVASVKVRAHPVKPSVFKGIDRRATGVAKGAAARATPGAAPAKKECFTMWAEAGAADAANADAKSRSSHPSGTQSSHAVALKEVY